MKKLDYIQTLKQSLQALEEKEASLIQEIQRSDSSFDRDPERSSLHDLWHTYRLQKEFKEFIEGLLQKQNTAGAF